MGNQIAHAIAEAPLTLEQKMDWHLQANCFPPVPKEFIPVAVDAINRANDGDWDTYIEYPNGKTRTVRYTIEGLFLEAFVDGECVD